MRVWELRGDGVETLALVERERPQAREAYAHRKAGAHFGKIVRRGLVGERALNAPAAPSGRS